MKFDRGKLEEPGWLYYLSPDKLHIVRLQEFVPGSWRKELYKLKPSVRVAHPMRIVHDEPGFKFPDAYPAAGWIKLTPSAAIAALKKEGK